jgi:hypothetical protein
VGFVHADDHDGPRERREGGDGVDRGFGGVQVGEDAGEQGADGEPGVAPQPVDAEVARRSSLDEVTDWTLWADKTITF